ncbi:tetratricopeptide repeat protein [Thalassotalea sp. M1531]|uniref:Tetratricopeptide repeat protein n=2 Tax=Thalassotalea algicola TaxID=2716224 RepID=A0A7Y0LA02_9GAMM|nr:tetratricopeptide repeat protein [Thalassotalea algicola]
MTGCLATFTSDKPEQSRATLSDLAQNSEEIQLEAFEMAKADRAEKLAEIYQQLLTLEPDPEIRTNVEYRLAQINTQVFEQKLFADDDSEQANTIKTSGNGVFDEQALQKLIIDYRQLLKNYPTRKENEDIQYQLAKALDLQGNIDASLAEIESLLSRFPETQYLAELNFRRGEIYFNLQDYTTALSAYQQVIDAKENSKYLVNSIYMSGWALFKLNRLSQGNVAFLQVIESIISEEKQRPYPDSFAFENLDSRYQNLLIDTQRVLSISLSQQQQAKSLTQLVTSQQALPFIYLYQHVLFDNLANFLIKKELTHDAELTYQAYIDLAPETLWAARFSLSLLDMYHRQGRFSAMHQLKNNYVNRYGLTSVFWQQANSSVQEEVLPHLIQFSDEHSRRLYAHAQEQQAGVERINAFADAADSLAIYLALAKLPKAKLLLTKELLPDEYLFAEANFEAKRYRQALDSYQDIAYLTKSDASMHQSLKLQAAYATTLTVRALLSTTEQDKESNLYQELIVERNRLDLQFIDQYPNDKRSLVLATHAAQYAFDKQDYRQLQTMKEYVLASHTASNVNATNLAPEALKQVQIVTQLSANGYYQRKFYSQAEQAYELALFYVNKQESIWPKMRKLLASSIYFQGQMLKARQPHAAVQHFLRLGQIVPESSYRVTAEFDAANLLLANQSWQQSIEVLQAFLKRYPNHEYSASIPAKLVQSYEALEQWELAAEQLLVIVASEPEKALKQEALYTAADYYLKAGNSTKALINYRTYAHAYPEPFDIAQEVRFKMSEFYRQSQEPNKRYFWFRKILKYHQLQRKKAPQAIQARAIELASTAAFGLGVVHQQTFRWRKLKAPLQKSLKRKQQAMKQAINYYQQVLDFQLARYVPQATFNLAEMYRQLAKDVIESERPGDLDDLALEEYEILLEELAYPFEEKAIEIHASNAQRAWQDIYDPWIEKSFSTLAELAPALYNKQERTHDVIEAMH